MAEKLCALRKKGGKAPQYTETSLWTNPSPSSSFAAQNVTLSESIDNFKYVKIKFRLSTSNSTENNLIALVEDLKNCTSGDNKNLLGTTSRGTITYTRFPLYVDNTTINFTTGYQTGVSGGSSNTSYAIPLEILGINELDHGKNFDETTLWTNSAPTNTFASQTVSLSASMAGYDHIKLNYRISTSDATAKSVLIKPTEFTSDNAGRFAYGGTSSTNYARLLIKASDTQITISDCKQFGGTTTTNTLFIPTSIVGCKFV